MIEIAWSLAAATCVLALSQAAVIVVLVLRWPRSPTGMVRSMASGLLQAFEKGRTAGHLQAGSQRPEPLPDFPAQIEEEPIEEPEDRRENEVVEVGSYR